MPALSVEFNSAWMQNSRDTLAYLLIFPCLGTCVRVKTRMYAGAPSIEVPHTRSPINQSLFWIDLNLDTKKRPVGHVCRGPKPQGRSTTCQISYQSKLLLHVLNPPWIKNGTCASMIIMWQAHARSPKGSIQKPQSRKNSSKGGGWLVPPFPVK